MTNYELIARTAGWRLAHGVLAIRSGVGLDGVVRPTRPDEMPHFTTGPFRQWAPHWRAACELDGLVP